MPDYRRTWHPGGTYFFTLNLLVRRDNDLLIRHVDALRAAVRKVRARYVFKIHAWVVLPDHLHCVIELPAGRSRLCAASAVDQDLLLEFHSGGGTAVICSCAAR